MPTPTGAVSFSGRQQEGGRDERGRGGGEGVGGGMGGEWVSGVH